MTTLRLHAEPVQDGWLDAYGHLNEAYYLVPFSNTTWIMQDHFGIGVAYFEQTGCAMYTVETHLRYLNDVRKPALMNIATIILGSDPKKIWFAHLMLVNDTICATAEFMVLHYDTRQERTVPMPDSVQASLKEAEIAQKLDWIGRSIGLKR
jgi:acyl-CoA thioester hydrolase